MRIRFAKPSLIAALIAAVISPISTGLSSAGSLARFVPDDIGMCVEIDDLAGRGSRVVESSVFRQIVKVPPLSSMSARDNFQYLERLAGYVARVADLDRDVVWREVFGGQVLFAVWPGEEIRFPGNIGLLLVESRDAALLARGFEAMAQGHGAQHQPVDVSQLSASGINYWQRKSIRNKREFTFYLAWRGTVGILTSSHEAMKKTLALVAEASGTAQPLGRHPAYQAAIKRPAPTAPWRIFVRPRAWGEKMLDFPVDVSDEIGTGFRDAFAEVWRSSEYWITTVEFDNRLRLESYWKFATDQLSENVRAAYLGVSREPAPLDVIPANAAFAAVGRANLDSLLRLWGDTSGTPILAELAPLRSLGRNLFAGLDPIDDVLPIIGPWTCVYAREIGTGTAPRVDWIVRADEQGIADSARQAQVARALQSGLRGILEMAKHSLNASPTPRALFDVVDEQRNDQVFTSLVSDSDDPQVLGASISTDGQRLWIGRTADGIVAAQQLTPSQSLAESPRLAGAWRPTAGAPTHLLYIDGPALLRLVGEHREYWRAGLQLRPTLSGRSVDEGFEQLSELLAPIDTLVLALRYDETGAAFNLDVRVAPQHPTTQLSAGAAGTAGE